MICLRFYADGEWMTVPDVTLEGFAETYEFTVTTPTGGRGCVSFTKTILERCYELYISLVWRIHRYPNSTNKLLRNG